MNGASTYSNGNSFASERAVRTLPWWFRAGLPEPLTLVSGL